MFKHFPKEIREIPNAKMLALLINDILDDEEFREAVENLPLEEIRTNLSMSTRISTGNYGHPDWKVNLFGGDPDEFGHIAPEHVLSPWHDIGLEDKRETEPDYFDDNKLWLRMVVTMPKGTRMVNRVALDERMNPIRHSISNSGVALRYKYPLPFNLGILPQTWLDPRHKCPVSKFSFEETPLMAVEIGGQRVNIGESHVKLLGCFGFFADKAKERIQWVMVCIRNSDKLSADIDTFLDMDKWLPGKGEEIFSFFSSNPAFPQYDVFRELMFVTKPETLKILKHANALWSDMIKNYTTTPRRYYIHHPEVRNGKMLSLNAQPSEDEQTNLSLGLSLQERVERRWLKADRKKTFYKAEYLEHVLRLQRRKSSLLLRQLRAAAPERVPLIEQKLKLIDEADPPPRETGMDELFEKTGDGLSLRAKDIDQDYEFRGRENVQMMIAKATARRLSALDAKLGHVKEKAAQKNVVQIPRDTPPLTIEAENAKTRNENEK